MNRFLLSLLLSLLALTTVATENNNANVTFEITLADSEGKMVNDAVFIFEPLFEIAVTTDSEPPTAIMNQIKKQFVPHVLVAKTGTSIRFPNADNIFHHVYSFSPTKQFELKLYKEFTAEPLKFDKPGIVDIGCNIHDWMLGYIVVTDSPFFAKTENEGSISLSLPKGDYNVRFWHPLVKSDSLFETKTLSVNESSAVEWQLSTALPADDEFDFGFGDY
ncbi:hypothetical protein KUL42_42630 [Alteromonas sp. KUL42]|uniref:methylamine utilization protein n=1 Tax=Alteromonas sp. KUL42 TaxID=2480797 RepID=UPI0010358BDC|nr:methylamine utilization protein [Alteromonas sp. KUL42]TAP30984.1 methylamine utilization protein [Alteromonas sp. KUL42]GEA09502.1 hypothetical protein KUL42_42630 [Alteromonas sp. KUL42]